jgi:hypothetical protein
MRLLKPVEHEDHADQAARRDNRADIGLVEVVRLRVHREDANVRRRDGDPVCHVLVDLVAGAGSAARGVGDDAKLDHPLDDRGPSS